MKDAPRISDAEWEVLDVIWKQEPLTAAQVFEHLPKRTWKINTVRTFLTRLEAKGVIKSRVGPDGKLYEAAIAREACVREASKSFIDRVFGGATASLLVHLVKSRPLTDSELAELEAILAEKRKKKK